jgi:indolepyruvate ferredoxin oxidoreductase beta subunit
MITGVGGQGNIMASGLVALAANAAGFKVVVGETYGASQRGGSVVSHIRLSLRQSYGPLVPYGQADVIVSFEPLEALRTASKYANPDTVVIVNTAPVYPVSVILKEADYPQTGDIIEGLKSLAGRVFTLDATSLAREAGDPRAQNIVMISALSSCPGLPLQRCHFEQALDEFLAGAGSEQLATNRQAFAMTVKLG